MKKIVYFVENGRVSSEDHAKRIELQDKGSKVYFSNGSVKWGFKDSCDAIVMSGDFPHIREWAESDGIEIIDMKPSATSESTTETEAETPKPRRGRKPKSETE